MTNSKTSLDAKIDVLADYVGRDFMRLARELRELQDIKPDVFVEVVERLQIGKRRAFALARIARLFSELGIPDDQLHRIGWTKLNRIGGHLDADNARHLLSLAENHTAHELDLILKGSKPIEGAKVMLLYLPEDEHARLSTLLIKHGAKPSPNGGLADKESALMKMLSSIADV